MIVNGDSDDDEDFVVKENKFQEDENKKNWQSEMENEAKTKAGNDDEEDENHGALVKKILESKEQLEHGSELNRDKNDLVSYNYYKNSKMKSFAVKIS